MTKLLASLTRAGVLQAGTAKPKGGALVAAAAPPPGDASAGGLALPVELHPVLRAIREGRPLQCQTCGVRFGADGREELRQHMDFHFRRNRRATKTGVVPPGRRWLLPAAAWLTADPVAEVEVEKEGAAAVSVFDAFDPTGGGAAAAAADEAKASKPPVPIVRAPSNVTKPTCQLCGEPIEMFWDGDAAEWMLRDAVVCEGGDADKFCHSACIA